MKATSGRLPQDFLDTLLERTDLVTLIEERVSLRPSGRDRIGLCPFHEEQTPSFTVSPGKGFYHCFGCGAHGNAIQWTRLVYHLSFRQAVVHLASRLGLETPKATKADTAAARRRDRLLGWVEKADQWFRRQLRSHPARDRAIGYLKGRGIEGRTAARFGLGFAPPDWSSLTRHLLDQGAELNDLVELGLTFRQGGGAPLDRVRNRLVFPLRDRLGRTRGFGARTIGQGRAARYLNSPDSLIFHKGHLLYGLFEALRAEPRPRGLTVVEGYLDVLTLHQAGFQDAVALMGTAGTAEPLAGLFRCCPRLVFALDGDIAGQRATWRLLERLMPLLEDGREVGFLALPEGEDPDALVREAGVETFRRLQEAAQPLSAFLVEALRVQVQPHRQSWSPEAASRFLALADSLLERLPAGHYRPLLARHLAAAVGLGAATQPDGNGVASKIEHG